MNKNEAWHPEVLAAHKRGKVIVDARREDQERSRAYIIQRGIADLQAKLDVYLKPGNDSPTTN